MDQKSHHIILKIDHMSFIILSVNEAHIIILRSQLNAFEWYLKKKQPNMNKDLLDVKCNQVKQEIVKLQIESSEG